MACYTLSKSYIFFFFFWGGVVPVLSLVGRFRMDNSDGDHVLSCPQFFQREKTRRYLYKSAVETLGPSLRIRMIVHYLD